MPRAGRFLEVVVEHLESFLAHEGVEITSPELFRKNGKVIGEIDITLRGAFGSSHIFIGIECRDRPSDGPQGLAWIREIHGKQRQLKVDKMIAVSSTGFNSEAIELASEFQIDLLTLTEADLDADILRNWIKAVNVNIQIPAFDFRDGIQIVVKEAANGLVAVTPDTQYLKIPDKNTLLSVRELIFPHAMQMFHEFQISGKEIWETGVVHEGPITAVLPDRTFIIDRLLVPLKFWREEVKSKMVLSAYRPPKEDTPTALAGVARVRGNNMEFQILALQKNIPGGKELEVKFLTLDNQPIPAFGTVQLTHPDHGTLLEVSNTQGLDFLANCLRDDCNRQLKETGQTFTCTNAVLVPKGPKRYEGYVEMSTGDKVPAAVTVETGGLMIEVGVFKEE